jgi:uncharacterized protein with NAD-binding domain and iron-sulfur cluster
MGALSAVFAITDQDGWADRFDITVYQLGWRLGGKAATSRDPRESRVLEHGYHMLFGFYENTFAVMRRCYDELGRDPAQPISTLVALSTDDEARYPGRYAFHRQNTAVLQQQLADGSWHNLVFDFPPNTDLPGDPGKMPTALAYFEMAIELLVRLIGDIALGPRLPAAPPPGWWDRLKSVAPVLVEKLDPASHDVQGHRAHLELIRNLVRKLAADEQRGVLLRTVAREGLSVLVMLMREYLRVLWALVSRDVESNWDCFKLWTSSDFVCTTIIGMIEDDVVANGIDSVDNLNFHDWIIKHATVPAGTNVTAGSCWMQAAYDSSFAYLNGDSTSPRTPQKPLLGSPCLGAGTALRGAMRLGLAYKGALAWKFQAGCAEALVAPVYQVLRRRGVKFKFFSKVEHLGVGDGALVDTIQIQQQVNLKNSGAEYEPLIDVKGLPCWPTEPLLDQIDNASAVRGQDLESDWSAWQGVGRTTLKRGVDFDHVVLAIPLGALPPICGELIAASPAWKTMIASIPTVRTLAVQVWVNKNLNELGWTGPIAPTGIGVEPIDTWADMTELIDRESWPDATRPKGVSYFCCAMADDPSQPSAPDPGYPATQTKLVRDAAISFLNTQSSQFWPNAHKPDGFDWQVLVAADGRTGADRLDDQFIHAGIDASERYVLSPAGSARLRLKPGESGFANLTLAGDWTENTINAGCMEATFISGLAASRAIAGYPKEIPGEEDFGPAGPRQPSS